MRIFPLLTIFIETETKLTAEKQIQANRENARKSTDPKTVEGKLSSSLNAIKHGFAPDTPLCGQVTRKRSPRPFSIPE